MCKGRLKVLCVCLFELMWPDVVCLFVYASPSLSTHRWLFNPLCTSGGGWVLSLETLVLSSHFPSSWTLSNTFSLQTLIPHTHLPTIFLICPPCAPVQLANKFSLWTYCTVLHCWVLFINLCHLHFLYHSCPFQLYLYLRAAEYTPGFDFV